MKASLLFVTFVAIFCFSTRQMVNADLSISINSSGSLLDILNKFKQDVAERWDEATLIGLHNAENFADNIKNLTKSLIYEAECKAQEAGHALSAIEKSLIDAGGNLQSFRINLGIQLQSVRNRVKRQLLSDVELVLTDLLENIEELGKLVPALLKKWQNEVQKEQHKILQDWNVWVSAQLELVAEETQNSADALDAAENIINELINRFSNQLNAAAKKLESDCRSFEEAIEDTIIAYQPSLKDLIEAAQDCLLSGDDLVSVGRQSKIIRRRLNSFERSLIDLESLVKEGLDLLRISYRRRSDVVQILVDFQLEKRSLHIKIEAIIDEYMSISSVADRTSTSN